MANPTVSGTWFAGRRHVGVSADSSRIGGCHLSGLRRGGRCSSNTDEHAMGHTLLTLRMISRKACSHLRLQVVTKNVVFHLSTEEKRFMKADDGWIRTRIDAVLSSLVCRVSLGIRGAFTCFPRNDRLSN